MTGGDAEEDVADEAGADAAGRDCRWRCAPPGHEADRGWFFADQQCAVDLHVTFPVRGWLD